MSSVVGTPVERSTTRGPANVGRLLPVLLVVFVDGMGATILIPVLPFYAISFGAGPVVIGLLLASYALAQVAFVPVLGRLSDRVGRKPVLVVAQIGTFASLVLLGLAEALVIVFAARILDGVTGANLSTVQSAVSDMTTEDERAKGLGLVGAAAGVGFIGGPLLSGAALALADNDFRAPAFLAAGFAATSVALTVFRFRETSSPELRHAPASGPVGAGRSLLRGPVGRRIRPLVFAAFAVQVVFTMFTATFTLYTLDRLGFDSLSNAIFLGIFGVMLIVMQGMVVGRVVSSFGEHRVLRASFVLTTVGFGLAALAPRQVVPWYSRTDLSAELDRVGGTAAQLDLLPPESGAGLGALAFVLVALLPGPLGFTLQLPTINSLVSRQVDRSEVGAALGMSAAFVGAGTVVGPVLGGYLFDRFAAGAPHAAGAVISLMVLIWLGRANTDPAAGGTSSSGRRGATERRSTEE